MIKSNKKLAIDFDGTIVDDAYPGIGKAKTFAFETLKKLQSEGYRLILWTYRHGKSLEDAVEFCRSNGLEFYAVNKNYPEEKSEDGTSRKLNADIYIDDRNVGGLPDWGVIYRMIKFGESIREAYLNNDMIPPKKNFFQKILGL